MSKTIGVDLGTSNSAAAFLEAGKPKIIASAEGASVYGKAFPSYVAFTKDSQVLVGEPAKRQAVSNPDNTFTAFKRKMGTGFKYKAAGKEYTPQQLSAFLLQKIKKDAEEFLGDKVEKADKGDSGDRGKAKEESEGGRVRCNYKYRHSEF